MKNSIYIFTQIKKLFKIKDSLCSFSIYLIKKLFFIYFSLLFLITAVQFFIEYKHTKNQIINSFNAFFINYPIDTNILFEKESLGKKEKLVSHLMENSIIKSVSFFDNKGIVIFQSIKDKNANSSLDLTFEKKLFQQQGEKNVFLGSVIIKYSDKLLFYSLKHKYQEIFFINIFLVFIIILIMWFFSKKTLITPLQEFSTELKEISIQNVIPTLTLDNIKIKEIYQLRENINLLIQEIFVLKDSFQVLIDDLTETQEKIVKQNENLEDEVKKQTKEIIDKEMKFRSIFEQSNVGIAITDKDGNILTCNESYANFLDFPDENELIGLNFSQFTHPEDILQQTKIMKKFFSGKVSKDRIEKRYITKNKRIIWADLSATVIKNEKNEVINFIAIVVDITERKKNEIELKRLYTLALDANSLTGLPGNNSIRKRIEDALIQKENFAAIYVDLDNFKAYNDNYGFAMGDKVLKHIANILKYIGDELHLKDFFLGHIGGDDFVVLVPIDFVDKYTELVINDVKESIAGFYNKEDFDRGFIKSFNRQGDAEEYPFVSISMGVVDLTKDNYKTYLEVNDALSIAKKQAKKIKGNSFFFEKRVVNNKFF